MPFTFKTKQPFKRFRLRFKPRKFAVKAKTPSELKTPVKPSSRVLNANNHEPSAQIDVNAFIVRVVALAQAISEKRFYAYQVEIASRIVESLINHDGDVITALVSRQGGKSEVLGAIAAAIAIIFPSIAKKFPGDWRLNLTDEAGSYRGFLTGVKIGIYAPKKEQADMLFERVKKALATDTAKQVLQELGIIFDVRNGNHLKLSNGSTLLCETASDHSKIEGASHHLLVAEECLTADAVIEFEDGRELTIGEVVKNKIKGKVKSSLNGKQIYREVVSWSKKGVREIIELTTESGRKVKCTPEHLIYTHEKGWTEAKDTTGLTVDFSATSSFNEVNDRPSNSGLNSRHYARGRKHILSSERFLQRPLYMFPRLATSSVHRPQMGSDEVVLQSRLVKTAQRRQGSIPSKVHNQVSSRVYLLADLFLSEGLQDRSQRYSVSPYGQSDSVLVYGRRKLAVRENSALSYRRISEKKHSKSTVGFNVKFRTSEQNRSIDQVSTATDSVRVKESLYDSHSAVRDRVNGLQAEPSGKRNHCLLYLRDSLRTLSLRKEKSSATNLLVKLSEESRDTASSNPGTKSEESNIRPCSVGEKVKSISQIGKVEVFDIGVEETHCFFANGLLVHNCQDISDNKIRRALHPMVAATNGTIVKIGTATIRKCDFYTSIKLNERIFAAGGRRNHFFYPYTVVIKYNSLYRDYIEKEKMRLGEQSDEFQTSYCARWIFERGMFVTPESLYNNKVCQISGDFSKTWYLYLPKTMRHMHVIAALDWGSTSDSTVLTLLAVDWNNPVEQGNIRVNGQDQEYTLYQKHILGWKEWIGDNYEYQFWEVNKYLDRVPNLRKIIMDSNTCGKPIFDRFHAHYRSRNSNVYVEPFNFQMRIKSDAYRLLSNDISGGRLTFPAAPEVRQTKEYISFVQQMLDLRKEYKQGFMLCHHPEEKGARDDFSDSLVLAVWGAQHPAGPHKLDFLSNNVFFRG